MSVRWYRPILGLAIALTSWHAGTAFAAPDWVWLDATTGRKVYSDLPPPASVPDKDIIRRPDRMPAYLPPAANMPDAAPAAAAPAAGGPKANDDAQARKKREADAAEAAKRKADEEQKAAARADNCARARNGLATLGSGARLLVTNAQGQQVYMDDASKAAESQRLQQAVQDNCQ